jgi:hypothetical protein
LRKKCSVNKLKVVQIMKMTRLIKSEEDSGFLTDIINHVPQFKKRTGSVAVPMRPWVPLHQIGCLLKRKETRFVVAPLHKSLFDCSSIVFNQGLLNCQLIVTNHEMMKSIYTSSWVITRFPNSGNTSDANIWIIANILFCKSVIFTRLTVSKIQRENSEPKENHEEPHTCWLNDVLTM